MTSTSPAFTLPTYGGAHGGVPVPAMIGRAMRIPFFLARRFCARRPLTLMQVITVAGLLSAAPASAVGAATRASGRYVPAGTRTLAHESLRSEGRGAASRMPYLSRFAGYRSRPAVVRSAQTGLSVAVMAGARSRLVLRWLRLTVCSRRYWHGHHHGTKHRSLVLVAGLHY